MNARLAEAAAIALIGDGVVGALFPTRHAARSLRGPTPWQRAMRPFADHPGLTRASAAMELGVGVWWAARLPADAQ